MKLNKSSMVLYTITDRKWLGDKSLVSAVEEAIQGGATFIQLREKDISYKEFVKLAAEVKAVTDRYKIPFVINDSVDVALEVDADGVHIGQGDEKIKVAREKLGQDKIIGVSANTVEEAMKAQQEGADYIGVGTVFNTSTKLDAKTVSFNTLSQICSCVNIPVVAIGGICKDNILSLAESKVDGICVISAIFAQEDIKSAAGELLKLSKRIVMEEV